MVRSEAYHDLDLLSRHSEMLAASAIAPAVANARGYRSVQVKAELQRLGFTSTQCRVPALLVPIWGVAGEIVNYQIRPDDPRIKKGGKAVKYETVAGSTMSIDVPPSVLAQLADPTIPLFITEGAKKADAAASADLCCIALLGVWNWRGTNKHGGTAALADWESIPLKLSTDWSRLVYLVFDSDVITKHAVYLALSRLKKFLESRGAKVKVVYLPVGDADAKTGLDDFLAAGHTTKELLGLAQDELRASPREKGDLPEIDTSEGDLARIADAAWDAVKKGNDPPFLFRRGIPCRIERDDSGVPTSRALNRDQWRHHLARLAFWYCPVERDDEIRLVPSRPPMDVVRDMLARPQPPLPALSRIVRVPVFAQDGELLEAPGYHPSSGIFHEPGDNLVVPPVPAKPTQRDLAKCRDLLLDELIGDFAFVGDAERAHAVALLLLPFVRDLIDGPTPLHLIEKPSVGTGAGLLADVLTLPALGMSPAVMTEGRDEDEWRKRITATLIAGPSLVLIDNLRRPLDSAALAAVLTARYWVDRILGQTENVSLPVRCIWLATGNNPSLPSEIARRTVRIRLDTGLEQPWRRSKGDFRHPNLRKWATKRRHDLIWAALVLVRAWLAKGRPVAPNAPELGSYESWSEVMSGILHVASIPGFLGNLDQFHEQADTESAVWTEFVHAWWDRHGNHEVRSADLWELATQSGLDLGSGSDHSQRTKLGKALADQRDRRFGAFRIQKAGEAQRAARWRLIPAGEGGEGCEVFPTPCAREESEETQGPAKTQEEERPHNPHDPHPSQHALRSLMDELARSPWTHPGLAIYPPAEAARRWDELWERWQERAAILEYDGGLPRETAELQAWQEVAN